MIKFLKRIPWKDILVTVLVVALAAGALLGVGTALTNKTKKVSPLVFERGALDANGLHVESKTSIYTKDLIECQGLEIEPDFEVSGTYQVFYYDTNKQFLGASALQDSQTDGVYTKGMEYPLAKYCRIVISPTASVDEDGYVDEDWKIRFYEVTSYANKYTIKVAKDQKFDFSKVDLLEGKVVYAGKAFNANLSTYSSMIEMKGWSCVDKISVLGYEQLKLCVASGGRMEIIFYDENGNNLNYGGDPIVLDALLYSKNLESIVDILPGTSFIVVGFGPSEIAVDGNYHLYFEK